MCCHVQLCDPTDCSPPGSSVHGIFQARILERVAISLFRGSFLSRDWKCISIVSCTGFFTTVPPGSSWWINGNLLYYSLFFKVFKNIIKGVDTFHNSHFHIMCCFEQPVPLKYFKWICIKYKKYHLTYGKSRWSWILCNLLNHFLITC